jgi:E3 ubiquitin-protein ligase HUWE1
MFQDLEHVDPEYHKSLMYILDHDVEEACPDTAFVTEVDFFGRKDIVELKQGGSHIMVCIPSHCRLLSLRLPM